MKTLTNIQPTSILSVELLQQISNHYESNFYKYLRRPLLDYSPDALVDFAIAIYGNIIEPVNIYPENTQTDYIIHLMNPYTKALSEITPKLEGFIGQLEAISLDPLQPETPRTLGEYDVYNKITAYLRYLKTGEDTENREYELHFPTPQDFIYSTLSPLRMYNILEDERITAIIKEADDLLDRHNRRLHRFIREELEVIKTRYLEQKEMSADTNSINSDNTIKKTLSPEVEEIVNQFLMPADPKLQKQTQKQTQEQDQNNPQKRAKIWIPAKPKTETKSSTPEEYLESFIRDLEPHYNNLSTKYVGLHTPDPANPLVSRPDETFAYIHAVKYANAHNLDLSTVLAQQSDAQPEVVNFDNINPVLLACMQVYLYNLSLKDVLPSTALDHGVIKGILTASERFLPSIARRKQINYSELAEALYDKILEYTWGFATALPLPDIVPQTAEDMIIKTKELIHRESVPKGDILPFDQTGHISRVIHDMQADSVTTSAEVLSVNPDPSTLTPVNIKTIKDIAYLLIGRTCTPYLLDGELLVHDYTADKFYRIIPNIGKDNYAAYGFKVYSHSRLNSRIYKKQELLKTSADYKDEYSKDSYSPSNDCPFTEDTKPPRTVSDEDLGHIKYEVLSQGNPQERCDTLQRLAEWDVTLTERINDIYNDTSYHEDHAKAQAEHRKILSMRYKYGVVRTIGKRKVTDNILFISAHKLAAYVYYPQAYSDLIIRKPIDPETGEPIVYHIHHVGGKGSEHDNNKENLRIITKKLNDALRHTSRPTWYEGNRYYTLKDYCETTEAGDYTTLSQATVNITSGDQITFKDRIYTLDPETSELMVEDNPEAPRYIYKDTVYRGLQQLTDALNLKYPTIQKGIWRTKNAGKSEYIHRLYKFYLDDNNDITVTLI